MANLQQSYNKQNVIVHWPGLHYSYRYLSWCKQAIWLQVHLITSCLRGRVLAGISWISADSQRSDYTRLEFRVCCGSGIDYLMKHAGRVQSLRVCVWILTVFPQDSCFDRLNACRKITGHGGPQGPGVILKAFCVIRLHPVLLRPALLRVACYCSCARGCWKLWRYHSLPFLQENNCHLILNIFITETATFIMWPKSE